MGQVDDAVRLAERFVGGLGRRWVHVQAVAARTVELALVLRPEDQAVVVAAAWLHDIGYAPDLIKSGLHPLDGAAYLAELGEFDPVVVQLVAHHTGAYIEAEERGLAQKLSRFPRPRAEMLDVLTAADVLTGPDGRPLAPEERIQEILSRYPVDDPVHRAITRSGPSLVRTANDVLARLADVRAREVGKPVGDA